MATCPKCKKELSWIEQYKKWYCYSCKEYHDPGESQAESRQPAQQTAPAQQQAPTVGGVLEYRTEHSPSFTAIVFNLKQGQSVVAEAGAMMYMHRTIEIKTHGRKGGMLKGLVTSALGGESFFVNTLTATHGAGELSLVSPLMGDIKEVDVSGWPMVLQSGAYLASDPAVNLDTKWQGLRGFLSERDFVMLHASGPGKVWISSFGGIIEKNLQSGEVLSVDTGHIVAFADNMSFQVRRVGGWKSTFLSGEGLVTDLTGPGKVLMQTRHLPGFVSAMTPYLPKQG